MHSLFVLPVDYYLAAWFALTAACTLYVAIDGAKNPEPSVMKWSSSSSRSTFAHESSISGRHAKESVGLSNTTLA